MFGIIVAGTNAYTLPCRLNFIFDGFEFMAFFERQPTKKFPVFSDWQTTSGESFKGFILGDVQNANSELACLASKIFYCSVVLVNFRNYHFLRLFEPCWQKVLHWHTLLSALKYGENGDLFKLCPTYRHLQIRCFFFKNVAFQVLETKIRNFHCASR